MTPRDHNRTLGLLHGLVGGIVLTGMVVAAAVEARRRPADAAERLGWMLYLLPLPLLQLAAEDDLLDTARRVLGANLSEFLLSGLGEPYHLRRFYTARSIREHGPGLTYSLEAQSESEVGLPGARDPLVMAALLHLLWTGGRGRDEVVFRDEELLGILSWPDTPESRRSIAEAVERYYCAAYRRTSTETLGAGCGERRTSEMQKLVPGYETTEELLSGPPQETRKSTIVHFTAKLVEEVSGTEKYFLGVDFEWLLIERVMPEGVKSSG